MPAKARYFLGVTRSGAMLEHKSAVEDDEELIVDTKTEKMAFDDDRSTPYSVMMAESMPHQLLGSVSAYTGGSKAITQDRWYLHVKAPGIFYEAATGLQEALSDPHGVKRTGMWILGIGGSMAAVLFLASFL